MEAGFSAPLMGAVRDPEAAAARRRYVIGRIAIYGVLVVFALIYMSARFSFLNSIYFTPPHSCLFSLPAH